MPVNNRTRPVSAGRVHRKGDDMNKYGNTKIQYKGKVYDSKRELGRLQQLELLERAGKITDLKQQVKFELLPSYRDPVTGKLLERAVSYFADFTYYNSKGEFIVEDTKGYKTADYILKRKMMLHFYGIRVKEV